MSTVLFVDDARITLSALQRAFADEPYETRCVDSARKALAVMAETPVSVIVTDLEMPEMDGFALLAEVEKKYPETVRLALSAHAGRNYLINAINTGHVYRYIVKPWDKAELKIVVRQAMDLHAVHRENRTLLARLEESNRLLESRVAERTRQLMAVERQAEVGKHAAYLVHNLNGPLQALRSALELAQMNLQETPFDLNGVKSHLDALGSGLSDVEEIVVGILDHVRNPRFFRPQPVDVNHVVERELTFFNLDPVFKKDVDKEADLAPDLPSILGNAVQIKQIVDNLIVNALDAMEASKTKRLRIKTRSEGAAVVITVADSGAGIAEADLPKIFNPDFTTKPVGKGTGLGLASVRSMVNAYGGRIGVTSRPGQGAVFEVRIPAAPL